MPSPTKDLGANAMPSPLPGSGLAGLPLPTLPTTLPAALQLHPPPSPGTHRTLRRLQSAHNLGAKATNQPSLISQQRLQQQHQQLHQQYQQLQLRQQHQHQHQHQQQTATLPQQPVEAQPFTPLNQQPLPPPQPQPQPPHRLLRASSPTRRNATINRSPQRGRANSDVPLPLPIALVAHNSTAMAPGRRVILSKRSLAADAMSLEKLFRDGPPNGDVEGALESARYKILDLGIKSDSDGMSSLRIYVWLVLLNAPVLETDAYLALIHRGPSPAYSKIRNDTFRTLTTDPLFRRRVSEASLIRLLNAIAWKLHDAREERTKDFQRRHRLQSSVSSGRQSLPAEQTGSRPGTGYSYDYDYESPQSHPASSPTAQNRVRALTMTTENSETSGVTAEPGTYVQGMNVLAAPFLYAARSEAEAFVAFHQLLTRECPGYIRGAMDGVHKGLALVDKVLAIVDSKLSHYLMTKNMSAEIYAFPSVLTLCACTPPLPEVLRLWDFLFAYGPHLNILCIVAQLVMIRTKIMDSPSPNKLLRSFPALQADQIKAATLAIINRIPDDVYADIVAHAK
ncbi:rab-GTPase-TBC domain-containing protein [Bombardia bombarda]|uniref:Rab-GTPase-TBC domain-containing protein n=1 Tax=Bombardia bombarda TaxID=252184 RepID=A0AA40BYQ4_9PEZI|nr:rab-GTPase-TBC domain-containing protein [Bombardia bombarda]